MRRRHYCAGAGASAQVPRLPRHPPASGHERGGPQSAVGDSATHSEGPYSSPDEALQPHYCYYCSRLERHCAGLHCPGPPCSGSHSPGWGCDDLHAGEGTWASLAPGRVQVQHQAPRGGHRGGRLLRRAYRQRQTWPARYSAPPCFGTSGSSACRLPGCLCWVSGLRLHYRHQGLHRREWKKKLWHRWLLQHQRPCQHQRRQQRLPQKERRSHLRSQGVGAEARSPWCCPAWPPSRPVPPIPGVRLPSSDPSLCLPTPLSLKLLLLIPSLCQFEHRHPHCDIAGFCCACRHLQPPPGLPGPGGERGKGQGRAFLES